MALMKCSAARQSLCPWSYSASTSRRFHSGRLGLSKNLYKILDVKPNVSPKDLKSAYYKLSLQYHPDVNKNADAAKKFQEISEAYEILSNEGSRRTYDSEVSGFSKPSDPGSPADIIFRQRMANRRTRTAANGAHFYTFKNEWDSARTQDFEEFQVGLTRKE